MSNKEIGIKILSDIPVYPSMISQINLGKKNPDMNVKYFIKNLGEDILLAEDDNLNYCYASKEDKEYSLIRYNRTKGDK